MLGFEYGYSTTSPDTLVIWEGAVRRLRERRAGRHRSVHQLAAKRSGAGSGLTLFLPHGYEGQGPEHSSARLERFLQLCARAQHAGRRAADARADVPHAAPADGPAVPQAARHAHAEEPAASQVIGFDARRSFARPLSADDRAKWSRWPTSPSTRIVFCSGKVYFDLAEFRRNENLSRTSRSCGWRSSIRFRSKSMLAPIARYKNAKEIVWCQEEPQNQGAWYQIRHRLQEPLSPLHQICSTQGGRRRRTRVRHSTRCTCASSKPWFLPRWCLRPASARDSDGRQARRESAARRQRGNRQ